MTKSILLLLLFIPVALGAQSLDDLNKEKGFESLKFGMATKKVKDMTAFDGSTELFNYTGSDIDGILSVKATKVTLFFPSNALSEIRLIYEKGTQETYDSLLKDLQRRYGEGTDGGEFFQNSHTAFRQWKCEKTKLQLSYQENNQVLILFKSNL